MNSLGDESGSAAAIRGSSILEIELESLYRVGQVLSRSLDFRETL